MALNICGISHSTPGHRLHPLKPVEGVEAGVVAGLHMFWAMPRARCKRKRLTQEACLGAVLVL